MQIVDSLYQYSEPVRDVISAAASKLTAQNVIWLSGRVKSAAAHVLSPSFWWCSARKPQEIELQEVPAKAHRRQVAEENN